MRDLLLPVTVSALLHGVIVVAIPAPLGGPHLEQVSADAIEIVLASGAPMAAEPIHEAQLDIEATTAADPMHRAAAPAVVEPRAPRPASESAPADTVATSDITIPRQRANTAAPQASPAPATPPAPPDLALPPVDVEALDLPTAVSVAARGDRRPSVVAGANLPPAYPGVARRRGVEGTVLLRVEVQPDGAPARIVVARTSGASVLDRAAVRAVERWRFEPARRGGAPVADWIEIPVEFHLTDSE